MSYRCGIGRFMAALGFLPDEPHVLCNGCGIRKSCCTKHGDLAQWVLKRKAPPGWLLIRTEDPTTHAILREDYCPECRAKRQGKDP